MRFEDTPLFSVTPTEVSTLTQVVEDAQLFLMADGAKNISDADKRLQASIADATKALRSIVGRFQGGF